MCSDVFKNTPLMFRIAINVDWIPRVKSSLPKITNVQLSQQCRSVATTYTRCIYSNDLLIRARESHIRLAKRPSSVYRY